MKNEETLNDLKRLYSEKAEELERFKEEWGDKTHFSKAGHIYFKGLSRQMHLQYLMMEQVKQRAKAVELTKKENRSEFKRNAKAVERFLKDRKEQKRKKIKEAKKQKEARAKAISGLVFKDFWKNCHKIAKFRRECEYKAQKKRENKQKVDDFLKMQSRLADEILREIKLSHAVKRRKLERQNRPSPGDERPRTRIEDFDGRS